MPMTKLMQQIIAKVSALHPEEQEYYATIFLDELKDEQKWDDAFATSQANNFPSARPGAAAAAGEPAHATGQAHGPQHAAQHQGHPGYRRSFYRLTDTQGWVLGKPLSAPLALERELAAKK